MPKELPELNNILHSGALSYGKWGRLFEEKLSAFLGVEHLLTTNSYASAIQMALTVLELKPGDEVISSPMSCLASNMPLQTYGLNVVWADVDPDTGTLSPDSIREKVTSKTKLIFHNHFCGYVGYVDEVNMLAKEFGIPVIDDCVEACGSKYKGNYTGNLGTDISIFSFQTVRLPNTIDGGAIVFNNKSLLDKAVLTRDFGINRKIFRDEYNEISPNCDIFLSGYGVTMSEVNSYIGCLQLEQIQQLLEVQRLNSECWDTFLTESYPKVYKLNARREVQPNYWVYGCLAEKKLDTILQFRSLGYYASGVHLNNNCYSVFGKKTFLPGVSDFNERFLAIPCGWWVQGKRMDDLL